MELTKLTNGEIAVRNSRHPSGPALIFTRAEMAAFIQDVEEGEFDELTGVIARATSPNTPGCSQSHHEIERDLGPPE